MKKKLTIILSSVLVLVFSTTAVFASSSLSNIEQKWFDFKKAVTDKMVEDGKMTPEEAETKMAELEERLTSSKDDYIYKRFSNQRKGPQKGFRNKGSDQNIASMYAELTNQTVEDVLTECKESEKSLWELAEENGVIDQLKEKVIEDRQAKLDGAVESGRITQEQADEFINQLKERFDNPDSIKPMMPFRSKNFKKPMIEKGINKMGGGFNRVDETLNQEL